MIEFATRIGVMLLPWQRWVLIHALELNPDGGYRFTTILIFVARQNGKTTLLKVLALWRMLYGGNPPVIQLEDHKGFGPKQLVLGTSTNLEYAREAWAGAVEIAEDHDGLDDDDYEAPAAHRLVPRGVGPLDTPLTIEGLETGDQERNDDGSPLGSNVLDGPWVKGGRRGVKRGALDTSLTTVNRSRYKVAAAKRTGGRSLSLDLGIADELREHQTWEPWAAMDGATTARPDSQVWGLSNMGDVKSVVLTALRARALAAMQPEVDDDTIAIFEYSAPEGCEVTDREAWRWANPSLGYLITEATLISKSKLPAEVFRPEHLCQAVDALDPAVSSQGWRDGADAAGTMDALRSQVVCGLEVSPDLEHVSLLAVAPLEGGRFRTEPVAVWASTQEMRQGKTPLEPCDECRPSCEKHEQPAAKCDGCAAARCPEHRGLRGWLFKVKPRGLAWISSGPAAAVEADLRAIRNNVPLPASAIPALCQALTEVVESRLLVHSDDPMLTAQVLGASKVAASDGFRFARIGVGHCDAAYALGAGLYLLRNDKLLPKHGKPRILRPTA